MFYYDGKQLQGIHTRQQFNWILVPSEVGRVFEFSFGKNNYFGFLNVDFQTSVSEEFSSNVDF